DPVDPAEQFLNGHRAVGHAEGHRKVPGDGHLGRLRIAREIARRLWRARDGGRADRAGHPARHRPDASRQAGAPGVHDVSGDAAVEVLRTMSQRPRSWGCFAATFALVMSFAAMAQTNGETIKPAPAFSAKQLAAAPVSGWITNGGSLSNERYSPLKQINRDNIRDVKAVWRTHLDGSGMGAQYSGQGQPLMYEGVLYMVTGQDDVFAVSLDTGKILWRYKAEL